MGEWRAPAKLNLTLHITGRRADGYHTLESLVVFTTLADTLRVEADDRLSLAVEGPFAGASGVVEENLVLRAARLLRREGGIRDGAALRLEKYIPAGAGLGGGSADAAAALQALAVLWNLRIAPGDMAALAVQLGADVPMFLAPRPCIARGIGELLEPLAPNALPPLHAVLVYPHRPLPTAEVYASFARTQQRLPTAHPPACVWNAELFYILLRDARNDLQASAMTLAPEIGTVLAALTEQAPPPRLVRMTGSGACCFALHDTAALAEQHAMALRAHYPQWWIAVSETACAP